MAEQHELMTIAEVASMIRTPVDTLRYWRQVGRGPKSFRVGRRVMYRRDGVESWLQQLEASGEPAA